ncbi:MULTISPECIES: helix-turn-helix transcriptional regulator [unclassified Bradyrhizobium]|uniref:helix-turn-helix transcriptional regulator n=1 Tax=unclassified Bradyrhizobium TaxID=2631580 RepID=UPI0028E25C05|nr:MULTISPECIES: AlpA family phage regulatory protein [unclassified Bradyrhizobium]
MTETEDKVRKMLNIEQVLQLVPVSRSTLLRMVSKGQFPLSHNISPNRCAWYEHEVLAWQANLTVNDRVSRASRRRA